MNLNIIIADDSVFKYFIEYMNIFDDYIKIKYNELCNYDIKQCNHIIAVQRANWLSDSILKSGTNISILNTEQLCDINVQKRLITEISEVESKLGYKPIIYDYSETNCKILNRLGFTTKYVPYNSLQDEIDCLSSLYKNTKKIYDIGFVGCLNIRRKSIIDALKSSGINVNIINMFGYERDVELAKCKYILNIHYESHFNIFESIRCNRLLAAGYKIISEDSIDIPNRSYLYQVSYDKLVEYIIDILYKDKQVELLLNYIYNCIKPKNNSEFIIDEDFNLMHYLSLKQDGIMCITNIFDTNILEPSLDYISINNNIIIRNNKPLDIEWLKSANEIMFDSTDNPIYRRHIPPPIETIDHSFIISKIILATSNRDKNYLEYGVRSGDSIEQIAKNVNTAIGVDINNYSPISKNIQFFNMLTDDFSKTHLNDIPFHYAFIDADHSSSQVIIDFEFIYNKIKKGGYIFLHDTYPCCEELLRRDYCNDCYLTPILIRKKYPMIQMLTLPINPGLTIIHKEE